MSATTATDMRRNDALEVPVTVTADDLRQVWFIDSLIEPGQLARQLNAIFGAATTGKLAGYADPKIAYRWARANGPKPAREALRRLYAASRIWSEVRGERSHAQAAAWFVAPHPELDEQQPLDLMMQGRFAEVSEVSALNDASPATRLKSATTDIAAVTALWHEASLRPLLDVVKTLAERFGAPSVSLLAGESNPKAAYRWLKNEGTLPSGEAAGSLYGIFRVVIALDDVLPASTARAWFLAANRALDERSPLEAASNGDIRDLLMAADRLLFALNQVRNNR